MELEDLKPTWHELNLRLTTLEQVQTANDLGKLQSRSMFRLSLEPIATIVASAIALLVTGNFVADNWAKVVSQPVGALAAGCVYGMSILAIGYSIQQIILCRTLDSTSSVVETSSKLALIEDHIVRSTSAMLRVGIALWIAFPVLAAQLVVNYDIVFRINPWFVIVNVLVCSSLAIGLSPLFRHILPKSRIAQWARSALAGSAIANARKALLEIEQFKS